MALVADTFIMFGFSEPIAQFAAPLLFSSAPKTKNTIGASFPWNVCTVPTFVGLNLLSYLVKSKSALSFRDKLYATFLNGDIT